MKKLVFSIPSGCKLQINANEANIRRPIKLQEFSSVEARRNALLFIKANDKKFWLHGLKSPESLLELIKSSLNDEVLNLFPTDIIPPSEMKVREKSFSQVIDRGMSRNKLSIEQLFEKVNRYLNMSQDDFVTLVGKGLIPAQFNTKDGKDFLVMAFGLTLGKPRYFAVKELYWVKVFQKFYKF